MDNGFTFDGLHSLADFDVIAIKAKTRTISAPGNVTAYEVGGVQGTMAFGDRKQLQAYPQQVTLYPAHDHGSETAATRHWRRISSWLGVGRRPLIWDSEPDKYVIAEVTQLVGDPSGWVEEGLKVTLQVQPELHSVRESAKELTLTDEAWHDTAMQMLSGSPAPIGFDVLNDGEAAIDRVAVIGPGGHMVAFDGLHLLRGDMLRVQMEAPAGAEILRADEEIDNALPLAVAFDQLTGMGKVPISAKIVFEEEPEAEPGEGDEEEPATLRAAGAADDRSAVLRIHGRGVWR